MDTDSKKLDEVLELARENNKMLHAMRRSQRFSSFVKLLYWAIILGSVFGVYYYFEPTIKKYMKTMQTSVEIIQKFEGAAGAIPSDMNTLKNLMGR